MNVELVYYFVPQPKLKALDLRGKEPVRQSSIAGTANAIFLRLFLVDCARQA
jgi:hypothetical protein